MCVTGGALLGVYAHCVRCPFPLVAMILGICVRKTYRKQSVSIYLCSLAAERVSAALYNCSSADTLILMCYECAIHYRSADASTSFGDVNSRCCWHIVALQQFLERLLLLLCQRLHATRPSSPFGVVVHTHPLALVCLFVHYGFRALPRSGQKRAP